MNKGSRQTPQISKAIASSWVSLAVLIVSGFLLWSQAAPPDAELKPPPDELILKGELEDSVEAPLIGRASISISWQAKRTDYDWESVRQQYEDFLRWYREKKKELEERFRASLGRERIDAARALFDFAVEADEKKKELDASAVYSGTWEGQYEENDRSSIVSADIETALSFTTRTLAPGSLEPLLTVSGDSRNGHYHLKGEISWHDGINQHNIQTDSNLEYEGQIAGKFFSRENRFYAELTPRRVRGDLKASDDMSKSGRLSAVGTYRGGTYQQKASWPEMEAFIAYLKLFAGDTSAPLKLETTEAYRDQDVLSGWSFDGELNWVPDDLPDIRHEYFHQWFGTFWDVLNEEISQAEDLKEKADKAMELYENYVKRALADSGCYQIRQDVIDACRLWAGRAGSSLDESFRTYFDYLDAWHEKEISEASDLAAKRSRAERKFHFAIAVTQDFQLGYLSEALQNDLRLWMNRQESYIDASFEEFFGFHESYWAERIGSVPLFEPRDREAEAYYRDCLKIFLVVQMGVLSEDLIDKHGFHEGQPEGYADRCFRTGWDPGQNYFLPRLPPPPRVDAEVEAYRGWLLRKMELSALGLVSNRLGDEVIQAWEKLLAAYPSLAGELN